jgi:hypothetical protein
VDFVQHGATAEAAVGDEPAALMVHSSDKWSIAFFNAPEAEWSYSGATNSRAYIWRAFDEGSPRRPSFISGVRVAPFGGRQGMRHERDTRLNGKAVRGQN